MNKMKKMKKKKECLRSGNIVGRRVSSSIVEYHRPSGIFGKLHRAMLERGIYLAPSAFEAGFTSLAHSEADIETTLKAFRESFAAVA